MQKPPNHVLQVQWVVEAWKQIDKEIIKKSFNTCGITMSDLDKIHCLGKGQPTEASNQRLLIKGGFYSGVASIQGRLLFKKIWYIVMVNNMNTP